MYTDILMAFVIALIINMFSIVGKYFKSLVTLTGCITLIYIYFSSGSSINFIGQMDLSIWLIFIIIFDIIISFIGRILWKKFYGKKFIPH